MFWVRVRYIETGVEVTHLAPSRFERALFIIRAMHVADVVAQGEGSESIHG